jgi:predicted outer membrane repeat protein
MFTPHRLALAAVLFLPAAAALAQTTYYVDPRGTGVGGTSWPNAFTNLHAALAVAQPDDTIKVAGGTYRPDVGHPTRPFNDRLAYWTYKPRVFLQGCYRGISPVGNPDDRSYSNFPTTLSGDIGVQSVNTDNSLTLMNANVSGQIIIDGFTFRCNFINNTTVNNGQVGRGGAVFIFNTPGSINQCEFRGNRIRGSQFQTVAAGLFIWQSDLSIIGCTFDDNRNESTGGAAYGGALYIEHGFPTVNHCTFTSNAAVGGGGAVFHRNAWQPAPSPQSTRAGAPTFLGCTFSYNTSAQGGGVWLWSVRPDDVALFRDCTFSDNTSTQNGAAIFSNPGGASFMQVRLEATTFAGNQSGAATFATCYDGAADLTVTGCTARGNGPARAFSAGGSFVHIHNSILRGQPAAGQPLVWTAASVPTDLRSCNIEGATLAHHTLENHQSQDPIFNPDSFWSLNFDSPCRNTGDNSLVPPFLADRIQGGTVDRGAFEYPKGPLCGNSDFNGDGDFGTDQDIEAFFACLAGNCCATCYPGGADFNADGDVGTDQDIEAFFRVLAGGIC